MIAGILHEGSGLGNQLFRYVATRTLAEDKGYRWGMINKEGFKGKDFMTLDLGADIDCTWTVGPGGEVIPDSPMHRFAEKKVVENGTDIRGYDPEINFVEDNTIIDGEFQDERYFKHRLHDIRKWFNVKPLFLPDSTCVIGFRGGEFQYIPELFLTQEYWQSAIDHMRTIEPDMKFVAVTDDPELARAMLPREVKVTHDISTDWRMVRNANYLIIANSSFYILPALLNNHAKAIIAPRYWARRNTGVWALPQNYYSDPRITYL
jgi:hypothetical protein